MAWLAKMRELLLPPDDLVDPQADRSVYERFAIPYTFKPQLSFGEAIVGVAAAFLRIFLGSLLFAVWGTYSLEAWSWIRNYVWRVAVVLPLFVLFLLSFTMLMLGISALARMLSPRRS
jgi:hypothetical protein